MRRLLIASLIFSAFTSIASAFEAVSIVSPVTVKFSTSSASVPLTVTIQNVGTSALAVGTGTTSGFGVATSSPTSGLNFDKDQFDIILPAGTTPFIQIKSSVLGGSGGGTNIDPTTATFNFGSSYSVVNATAIRSTNEFSVGVSTFVVKEGKVGIGTTAPASALSVVGNVDVMSGNLGVGTTNPSYPLDFKTSSQNDIASFYSSAGASSLLLGSAAGPNVVSYKFQISGTDQASIAYTPLGATSNSGLKFLVQGAYEGMRLNNTGYLGIGTTAASYRLHVSSGAGTLGTIMAISTGTVDLFAVHGTSVSFEVPLVLPDGTVIDDSSDLGSGSGDMLLSSTQTVSGGKVHTSFLTVRSSTMQITAAAGANVNTPMFAVSTGPVNVFSVLGGSINVKVPFVWPDGSVQTSAPSGTTQWTTSGSNIGYTGGKVGVGITNPSASLHVSTAAGTTTAVFAVSTGSVDLFKVSGASISVNAPMYVSAAIVGQGTGNGSISLDGNTVSTGVVTAVGFEGSASSLKIGPSGNTNQILVHSTGTTISSNGKSTGTWTATNIDPVLWTDITISSDSLAAGGTFWMLTAPSNSAITITSVVPLTYSVAASSANFSLQEKVTQNANGSQIFTGTYSTGTWNHMNPITSFADSSIAAGSSVFLVTKDGGATAGTPRALSVILYYKYATP